MSKELSIEFHVPTRKIFVSESIDGGEHTDVRFIEVPETNNVVDEVNVLYQLYCEDQDYDEYDIEVFELEDISKEIED